MSPTQGEPVRSITKHRSACESTLCKPRSKISGNADLPDGRDLADRLLGRLRYSGSRSALCQPQTMHEGWRPGCAGRLLQVRAVALIPAGRPLAAFRIPDAGAGIPGVCGVRGGLACEA